MHPIFFGQSNQQLYGIYHMPKPERALPVGAVLCQPILHEYADARRALRSLADRLAERGIHALRFDYRGTGDSAGGSDACGVEAWQEDVNTAVEELKLSRGLESVGLVGLRFGATLAAHVAARRDDIPFTLLWEPILSGAAYLRDLRVLQEAWLDWEVRDRPSARSQASTGEVFGNPLSDSLALGLSSTDLPVLTELQSARTLFVNEGVTDGIEALRREVLLRDSSAETCLMNGGQVWQRAFDGEQASVPRELLCHLADWVADGAAA